MPQNISSGGTPLHQSLERARRGDGPSVGQWLELPGYSLARTVAPLGEDVCLSDPLVQNPFASTFTDRLL
jgi:hypothetical protein